MNGTHGDESKAARLTGVRVVHHGRLLDLCGGVVSSLNTSKTK
jgi:hypothetical protein